MEGGYGTAKEKSDISDISDVSVVAPPATQWQAYRIRQAATLLRQYILHIFYLFMKF